MKFKTIPLNEILENNGSIPGEILFERLVAAGISIENYEDIKVFGNSNELMDWLYFEHLSKRQLNSLQKEIESWSLEDIKGMSIGEKILKSVPNVFELEGVYFYRLK